MPQGAPLVCFDNVQIHPFRACPSCPCGTLAPQSACGTSHVAKVWYAPHPRNRKLLLCFSFTGKHKPAGDEQQAEPAGESTTKPCKPGQPDFEREGVMSRVRSLEGRYVTVQPPSHWEVLNRTRELHVCPRWLSYFLNCLLSLLHRPPYRRWTNVRVSTCDDIPTRPLITTCLGANTLINNAIRCESEGETYSYTYFLRTHVRVPIAPVSRRRDRVRVQSLVR